MKKSLLLVLLAIVCYSCYREWVFREEFSGVIIDVKTRMPIEDVLVRYIPLGKTRSFFNDSVYSKSNGGFVFRKIASDNWTFPGLEAPKSPPLSSSVAFSKIGYVSDTIDIYDFETGDVLITLYPSLE